MKAQISIGALALAPLPRRLRRRRRQQSGRAAGHERAARRRSRRPTMATGREIVTETPEGGYPDGQSRRAGEAGRICLDHLPALRRIRRARRRPAARHHMSGAARSAGNIAPIMLFPTDPGIFMLLRCQGATPFFRAGRAALRRPGELDGARLQSMPPEQRQQLEALPPDAEGRGLWSAATGLDQFFRQRGMPEARISSCLADRSGLERLAADDRSARTEEQGSPARRPSSSTASEQDVGSWAALEPRCARRSEAEMKCQRSSLAALPPPRLALPAAVAPRRSQARRRSATGRRTVARTPEGGFRMGNPDAPVKLIEYLSLTCPHCADLRRGERRAPAPRPMSAAAGSASNIATSSSTRPTSPPRARPLRGAARFFPTEPTNCCAPRRNGWAGSQALTEAQRSRAAGALPPMQIGAAARRR